MENAFASIKLNRFRLFVFFIVLCFLHALRNAGHFLHPSLQAEEGSIFLSRIIDGRWDMSSGGYLNLFTFASLALFSKLSLKFLPWITSTLAIILTVFTYSYLRLPHWE